ncbi:MAG: hypothetical protein J7L25_03650 [Deltaproteobacteria bacterium]|nr:hypothetical protein [Candidatus Tharpella aukensis]
MKKIISSIILAIAVILSLTCQPARAAVANFCWCGFFVSQDDGKSSDLAQELGKVYRKHIKRYEDRKSGIIIKTLKRLRWDEMNYYGYVGLPQDSEGEYSQELENLDTTYGLFIAVEQVLPFSPDESVIHGQSVRTYSTYVFGSLNLFHLKSRNLLSSRPFLITHQDSKPSDSAEMLDLALEKFALRLDDPNNRFTKQMLADWQDFFGPPGEQRDVLRQALGELDNTFGVAPLCDGCIRIKGDNIDTSTDKQLKTFIRYYFNATMANYKPVVFLPGFSGKVTESVHTLVTATKEGDVTYSDECLSGYGDSGQTQLCLKIPPPRNLVKLSLRCLVENGPVSESDTYLRTYNSMLDIGIFFADQTDPVISSLSNNYQQLLTTTRKPSNIYYFNSLINAVTKLRPVTLTHEEQRQ